MLLEERSRRVVRVFVHEQNSLRFYDRRLLRAAYYRGRCPHHAGGSGGSLVQVESAASRPHRALRACQWPRHRIDLQAVSEATSGHQWLVMGGTSAGGGRTATWTYGGSCGTALRDGSHGVLWSSLVGVAACNSQILGTLMVPSSDPR